MTAPAPVAIVTGASRGIGLATARELFARGYRLTLVARSESDLKEAVQSCGQATIVVADLSRPDDIDRIVSRTVETFGRVDALINNAGLAHMKPTAQLTPDQWQATLNVNLSPIYYFVRRLWDLWRRQGASVMVNVSSMAARDPFPGLGAYGAAKAAINLLGLALAREGAEIGLRVHTVAPAATETAMLRSLFTDEQYATSKTLDPLDVAKIIVQCVCGDLKYTSGQVIYVQKTL